MRQRRIYYALLALTLLSAPYTIFSITPSSLIFLNSSTLLSFFQRLFGLWAFVLLFFQIFLGYAMHGKITKLGAWVHKVHITQGLFAYAFVFFHPFMYLALLTQATKSLDPFYVFTDICILCKTNVELFYTFGRVAFWLITFTVTAGYFRTKPMFRRYWKLVHYFNYVAFFAVGIHSWFIGTDVHTAPYSWFHIFALAVVAYITAVRIARPVIAFLKSLQPKQEQKVTTKVN